MNKSISEIESTRWFNRFHKSEVYTADTYNALKIAYQLQTPYSNVAILTKKRTESGSLVWVVVADFFKEFNLMTFDDDSDESKAEALSICKDMNWPSVEIEDYEYKTRIIDPADYYKVKSGHFVEI